MSEASLQCWNCGASLDDVPRPISRHATCSACFNELHCCRLCRHYDPQRNMQCFEDRADPPLQKDNANFCEFFAPRANAWEASTGTRSTAARDALSELFDSTSESGDAPNPAQDAQTEPGGEDATAEDPAAAARRKLDGLFGD